MPDSSGSVDLSKVGATSHPRLENLSPEDQDIIDKMAENENGQQEPEGEPVRTAFLVLVGKSGEVGISLDLNVPVVRDYVPSMDDVYGAVSILGKNIEVSEAATGTAQVMQQIAHQQMQQMQAARIAQGLNLPGSGH